MKAAVYPVSRVYYEKVIPSIKSLMINSDVERIYLMIEDDEYPGYLPECVTCLNAAELRGKYLQKEGPNITRTPYVYLCLLRVAYADIFRDLDRILALDADTIVIRDIGSELWDLNMRGCHFAGAIETKITRMTGKPYANMGMAVFDLARIREDRLDQEMIQAINTRWYQWLEQDCINDKCRLLPISSDYNQSQFSKTTPFPKIMHYAYTKDWEKKDPVLKYKAMNWEDCERIMR